MANIFKFLKISIFSMIDPGCRKYFRAKKLHESSKNGGFPDGFYYLLTERQKLAAQNDPKLNNALIIYKECAQEQAKVQNRLNEGISYHQIGILYLRQGLIVEATNSFQESVRILHNLADQSAMESCSSCYFRMAEIAFARGDNTPALELLQKGRQIDASLGYLTGMRMNDELLRIIEKR